MPDRRERGSVSCIEPAGGECPLGGAYPRCPHKTGGYRHGSHGGGNGIARVSANRPGIIFKAVFRPPERRAPEVEGGPCAYFRQSAPAGTHRQTGTRRAASPRSFGRAAEDRA